MVCLQKVALQLPKYRHGNADVARAADQWLKDHPDELSRFLRVLNSAQTTSRYFIQPAEDIIKSTNAAERTALFEREALALGSSAVVELLERSNIGAEDIGTFIFTSCSAPVIPSIDAEIVQTAGLKDSVARIPIYQHGCAGGVVGLSLANRLCRNEEPVLLTSVELCSLVFQQSDITGAHLVGSAIFGDGAAAALIAPGDSGLVFRSTESRLLPHTRHLMGYDILDDGSHLRLDKMLPEALAEHVPEFFESFLGKEGLTAADIDWWLVHPGGVKIIKAVEKLFSLEAKRSRWSWESLRRFGNLSSASILFVLSLFLESGEAKPGDKVVVFGVGPGLTLELLLLEMS